VKTLWLAIGISVLASGSAGAQLARTQPQEKLLIVPFPVSDQADTTMSLALADAVRDRVTRSNRYNMLVVPKNKICEALGMSGFACTVLEPGQARELARAMGVDAYVTGRIQRVGNAHSILVRVVDVNRPGYAATFEVNPAAGGTGANGNGALADTVASLINTVIKAGEHARACMEAREKNNPRGAVSAAQRAFQQYPKMAAAHLCMFYIHEINRAPADSMIAALRRALEGDSLNVRAWESLARQLLAKNDSAGAVAAFEGELRADPANQNLRIAVARLHLRMKKYDRALTHARAAQDRNPSDNAINELVIEVCKEGAMWSCQLGALEKKAELNPTELADSTFYPTIIGAAQLAHDTVKYAHWTYEAAKRFPRAVTFLNAHGDAMTWMGKSDSALVMARKALEINANDMTIVLRVASALIERPTWDSARYNGYRRANDSTNMKAMHAAFAPSLDTAKTYLDRALAAPDTMTQLNATALLLRGGTRLAQQAQAFDRAYPWLDQVLTLTEPRTTADTVGFRAAVRTPASFWYALASMQTIGKLVTDIQTLKNCAAAKALADRMERTRQAGIRGARISPGVINQILQSLQRYDTYLRQVKTQLKCTNF
jgi:tetratricopeptide (TPR) repeat protein